MSQSSSWAVHMMSMVHPRMCRKSKKSVISNCHFLEMKYAQRLSVFFFVGPIFCKDWSLKVSSRLPGYHPRNFMPQDLDFPKFPTDPHRWVLFRIWLEKRPTWTQRLGNFVLVLGSCLIGGWCYETFWKCWKEGHPSLFPMCFRLDIWLWLNRNPPKPAAWNSAIFRATLAKAINLCQRVRECGEFCWAITIIAT